MRRDVIFPNACEGTLHAEVISTPGSACTVRVCPTNEDLMIARRTRTLLFSAAAQHL